MLAVGINLDDMAKPQFLRLGHSRDQGHTLAAIVLMLKQDDLREGSEGGLNQRLLGFIIARLVSRLFSLNREDTVSVTFASGMRNISAAMVIAISFFPPQSVLPVISGIVLQQSAVAIASHFLFGRKPGKDNMNTVKERT